MHVKTLLQYCKLSPIELAISASLLLCNSRFFAMFHLGKDRVCILVPGEKFSVVMMMAQEVFDGGKMGCPLTRVDSLSTTPALSTLSLSLDGRGRFEAS